METSCGVVLVNLGAVLLLQYPQGHWDFPKGHVEDRDGGDHRRTVRREVEEETGIVDLDFVDAFQDRSTYSFRHKGRLVHKEVHWLLAETETLEVRLSHEHRGHLWLDWEQAEEVLSHEESRAVLRSARDMMQALGRD